MREIRVSSIIVLFFEGDALTENGYDLTNILDDYIQVYQNKIFVTCFDKDSDDIKDILDKPLQLRIEGEKKFDAKVKAHLFKPEIPMKGFGLQTQLVFDKL